MGKIENIIQKLTEAPNLAKAGNYKVGDVTFSKDGGTKYTVLDIDDETGSVEWETKSLPNYGKLMGDSTDLVDTAKGVFQKSKDDSKFRDIYEDSKIIRNKIRTHLRNEYPDEYKRVVMRMNEGLDTVSSLSAMNDKRVDAVAKAISKRYDIKDDSGLRGTIRMALADHLEEMSTTGGGSASFTPGSGMTYATPYAFKRPKKKQKAIPESKLDENLDLDAYGYKLVPKNKAGNYVQKGSKLDVKQLFEDQKDFQLKRVAAFDVIEQEMNDIYKMLSNAKNETSEYYNDNPSSYTVIKPTDLVLDYIKDIKNLLKGE
jgi:hypothetical protein|tara:strand:- start:1493 stop:2440 length:948 start_codon:yes stop_codon:yes gene_type:complete